MTMQRGLVRAAAATTALACAVALAACSQVADDGGDNGDNTADGDGTVAVTHAFGVTEVPKNPTRALSFSQNWTDAFAELGSPVHTQVVNTIGGDEMAPWNAGNGDRDNGAGGAGPAEETVEVNATSADLLSTFGMEAVAEKDPDVIFTGYLPDRETYDALSAIAPTVATVGSGKVDDWRKVTETAGDILDVPEKAATAIDSVDRAITGVKETYPAVDGATFAYAAYRDRSFSVISSPEDAANAFLTDLGLVSAADQMQGTRSVRGVSVSAENIDMLDVDLLVLWVTGETPEQLSGWSELTSVKRGSAALLDTVAATALGSPTVRSIPWAIDELDPYFAALEEGSDNE